MSLMAWSAKGQGIEGEVPVIHVWWNEIQGADVVNNIKALVEQKVGQTLDDAECMIPQVSPIRTTSVKKRQRRRMISARRRASTLTNDVSIVDDTAQLYTLVSSITGEEDGIVTLQAIPAVVALLELDEMSFEEFGSALKAGCLAELGIILPNEEINSSSLLDEAVLEDTKRMLYAPSGLSIQKDPSNS
ncbi:uncharacterized protein PHALS_08631 [Plasmopara halstedii]|uniref:Uncharacterized protein n=1 Tax=Plasmopara halstedii TaxID=4781 RepID=A0A0P1ADS3_PLAHL|nr:uncharacterized protein PHALS_08631 [Plasmopara halstedii]CEG38567.1 hypothetical protein PHALS_08631 [Plasmopara halstedii]|eukprot:XP_024574936.1 hypothetical protein PHALS_08631 [Plasmopara halstedii]